jgi:hypothetical protein
MTQQIQRGVEQAAVAYQPYLNRTLVLLVVMLAVSVFLYSAFLLEAVAHTAAKSTAERTIGSLNEQLSALESQYLALTQSLTPQKAAALGFVTPTMQASVYAHGESGSLSFQSK